MHTIYHYYQHNNLFRAGFLIGAGVAFMISGATSMLFSYYIATNKIVV
jgi:hypothetical protein